MSVATDPATCGQAHFAAGAAVNQAFMLEARQVLDDGVPVVDVHLVFDGFIAVLVAAAVLASFYAAARHG